MSLCVALNESVRYNESTIKYLENREPRVPVEDRDIFVGVRGFFVFIFKSSNAELFIVLKFKWKGGS